jgi:hypothetical protein
MLSVLFYMLAETAVFMCKYMSVQVQAVLPACTVFDQQDGWHTTLLEVSGRASPLGYV